MPGESQNVPEALAGCCGQDQAPAAVGLGGAVGKLPAAMPGGRAAALGSCGGSAVRYSLHWSMKGPNQKAVIPRCLCVCVCEAQALQLGLQGQISPPSKTRYP